MFFIAVSRLRVLDQHFGLGFLFSLQVLSMDLVNCLRFGPGICFDFAQVFVNYLLIQRLLYYVVNFQRLAVVPFTSVLGPSIVRH